MKKQDIENLIKELVEKTTILVNKIEAIEEKNSGVIFSLEVSEPHHFTAREGEALHALNHLVRRIIESKESETPAPGELPGASVLVDVNDFQKRRIDSVRAVAHMMSERARYFKSNIEVDPMSAFERRIIHEFIADAPDLETESIGAGNTRRVVIKYIGDSLKL